MLSIQDRLGFTIPGCELLISQIPDFLGARIIKIIIIVIIIKLFAFIIIIIIIIINNVARIIWELSKENDQPNARKW